MTITAFAITGSQILANRTEVIGNLSGNATGGPYKIPLRIVYPTGASPVLNRTLIETWNTGYVEQFGIRGLVFIVDGGYLVLGIQHLVEVMGYTYVEHEWNKDVVDQQVATGISNFHTAQLFGALAIPFDPTWLITDATDAYEIMADASTFSRNPLAFNPFAALPPPPTSAKTFGFGCSQPAMLLRGFVANLLNSGLGAGFPNGLVYEGILACGAGGQARQQSNVALGFFTVGVFNGATPASEGVFVSVNPETDLFIMQGIFARTAGPPPGHYGFYEIAGNSHIPGELGDLVRPIQNNRRNGPVGRAMLENLRAKVDSGTALPPSVFMEGSAATRAQPLFPFPAPITGIPFATGFTTETFVGVPSDDDGNFLGGIRLPHMRTRLPNGTSVGAPLGTYRGTLCLGLSYRENSLPNAVQICPSPPLALVGTEPYLMLAGFFAPWDPALIACRYRDASEYVTFVEAGANYALANRWILPVDRDFYIAEASTFTTQTLQDVGLRRLVPPNPPSF